MGWLKGLLHGLLRRHGAEHLCRHRPSARTPWIRLCPLQATSAPRWRNRLIIARPKCVLARTGAFCAVTIELSPWRARHSTLPILSACVLPTGHLSWRRAQARLRRVVVTAPLATNRRTHTLACVHAPSGRPMSFPGGPNCTAIMPVFAALRNLPSGRPEPSGFPPATRSHALKEA